MKNRYDLIRVYRFLPIALLHLVAPATAADPANRPDDRHSGFTWFSDEPKHTQWGLGLGAGYGKSIYKDDNARFSVVPLVLAENRWFRLRGPAADIKIARWESVEFTLRTEYGLGDGYESSDASILKGMDKRKDGLWLGPAMKWETPLVTLSARYLFAGNKGQKAQLGLERKWDYGEVTFRPHADVEWLSDKNIDYYYGVKAPESRAGRSAFQGKSTYRLSAGVRVDYDLTAHQTLSVDAGVSHAGSGISDSPIVDSATLPAIRLAYFYYF